MSTKRKRFFPRSLCLRRRADSRSWENLANLLHNVSAAANSPCSMMYVFNPECIEKNIHYILYTLYSTLCLDRILQKVEHVTIDKCMGQFG